MASRIPPRTANAIAQKPENSIDIATPPSRHATPATTRTNPGRGCSIATSRSASAGGMRPARRAAAKTASCAIRTPMPSAATSGTIESAGANAGPTSPRSARTSTMRFANGRPATTPSAPATSDTSSASPAISRRICGGVAPRARSTAVSRRRWAMARANVPATTNRATAPAMPPRAPKMAISPARSAAVGSPASASAACPRSRTSIPTPEALLQAAAQYGRGRPGLGDHTDGVDPSGSAGERRGDGGREEHRGLALISHATGVGETADAVARVTGRSDDPQHGADARAQPDVGDHVVRPAGRAAGGEAIRRERRAVPAVADQPVRTVGVQVLPLGVPGAGGEGDVAHGAGDAGHGGDALDELGTGVGVRGSTSTPSASSPWPIVTVGSARTTASVAARRPAPGGPSAPAISSPVAEASVTASQIATNAPASVPRRARSVCSEMRSMSGPQSGQPLGDLLGGRGVQLAGEPPVGHEHDAVRPRGRRRDRG